MKEQVESMRECYADLTIDVRVIEGERPRWPYLRDMLLLPSVVKKGRYDIVHVHFGLTLVSTLFVRVPVVVTFHGSDLLLSPTKYLSKILAPKASKVIVVSQKLRDSLGFGEVIPCGISVNDFALPASYLSTLNPTIPGKLRILFPSDPDRKVKNYKLFRAACRELERRGNRVTEIHLVNIKREKVPELYWNCDVMLLTSLSEGSPTVIKEAIAAKLPFVSVNVGDVKDWAELVNFGVVLLDRDPISIANALTMLLSGIKQRALFDNGKCLEAMDLSNIAKKIKGGYDQVIKIQSQRTRS